MAIFSFMSSGFAVLIKNILPNLRCYKHFQILKTLKFFSYFPYLNF